MKLAEVGGRVFDAGNILFPLAYLLADVLTEVYGFRAARRVILLGFACNVLAVGAIQLALRLPAADFWAGNQEAYETVLGTTWRIFVASLVAYLVGRADELLRALAHEGGDRRALPLEPHDRLVRHRAGARLCDLRHYRLRGDRHAAPGHDRDHVGDQGGLGGGWRRRSRT